MSSWPALTKTIDRQDEWTKKKNKPCMCLPVLLCVCVRRSVYNVHVHWLLLTMKIHFDWTQTYSRSHASFKLINISTHRQIKARLISVAFFFFFTLLSLRTFIQSIYSILTGGERRKKTNKKNTDTLTGIADTVLVEYFITISNNDHLPHVAGWVGG